MPAQCTCGQAQHFYGQRPCIEDSPRNGVFAPCAQPTQYKIALTGASLRVCTLLNSQNEQTRACPEAGDCMHEGLIEASYM